MSEGDKVLKTLFPVALAAVMALGLAKAAQSSRIDVPDTCYENGPADCLPVEETVNYQRPAVEETEETAKKHKPLKYRARYAECRRLMQLKVKEHKGTYKQARRCRSKLRWRSTWAVGLTIRMVFPRSEWENAKAVATCENRGTGLDNRRARRGRAGERGHFQIHPIHSNWVDMDRIEKDALYMTQIAHRIWQQARWRPWVCAQVLGIR